MARVLIAGCGYIGSALGEELVAAGHVVFGLRRSPASLPEGIEPVEADLTDRSRLAKLPGGIDVLFYTAAAKTSEEAAYRHIYVDGLRNVLSRYESKMPQRILFTSSTAVYGQDDGSVVDEASPTAPRSFRGRILLEAEALVAGGVVLRLAGIYGPGRTRRLDAVQRGEAIYASGRYANLIHRDDAVGALIHLMALERPEALYLGVDSEPVETGTLLRWLAARTGSPPPREGYVGATRGGNRRYSNRRLVSSGYSFRFPTFREGYGSLLHET